MRVSALECVCLKADGCARVYACETLSNRASSSVCEREYKCVHVR